MTKIEEIEQKIETINIVLENLKLELENYEKTLAELKESKKEGKWKPKEGEIYWFRDSRGAIINEIFCSDCWRHTWREKYIPIFETREACDRYWHFMDTVKEKSYEFTELEWENDEIIKFTIYYDFLNDEFCTTFISDSKFLGEIYFRTKEDAQYIIDNFKDELMEYFV